MAAAGTDAAAALAPAIGTAAPRTPRKAAAAVDDDDQMTARRPGSPGAATGTSCVGGFPRSEFTVRTGGSDLARAHAVEVPRVGFAALADRCTSTAPPDAALGSHRHRPKGALNSEREGKQDNQRAYGFCDHGIPPQVSELSRVSEPCLRERLDASPRSDALPRWFPMP